MHKQQQDIGIMRKFSDWRTGTFYLPVEEQENYFIGWESTDYLKELMCSNVKNLELGEL